MAPSHYLNWCGNIVNWMLKNKFPWNCNQNWCISIQENVFENVVWKKAAILSEPQCVNTSSMLLLCHNSVKGHLHQRGKCAGRPSGSRPRVPQWIGLKELYGAVYTAAGPLCLRGGRTQRLLMERFFCGTRRNRERWLVGIYRSKIQCREMGLQ